MISAIQTEYKGYLFRSRLEARWAVFFDEAGIDWKYEVEGFQRQIGGTDSENSIGYLPDFYLPESGTWVEVKGSTDLLKADWQRLAMMLDYGSPLPGVEDSYPDSTGHGLLLLGDIPLVPWGLCLHPLIQHRKGLIRTPALFFPEIGAARLRRTDESTLLERIYGVPPDEFGLDSSSTHWSVEPTLIGAPRAFARVIRAYKAARGSRFEHGESGGVR